MKQSLFPKKIFPDVLSLISRIGLRLTECNMMLGTAESCTGGLVSALCTHFPGSSAWFAGGVASYANTVKERILGVDSHLLAAHGAVSRPVAEAMAAGALSALGADITLAVTGIAGPGGGFLEKPVGTVWIAVAMRRAQGENMRVTSLFRYFPGNRMTVRATSVFVALQEVERILNS